MLASVLLVIFLSGVNAVGHVHKIEVAGDDSGIPLATRAHWMRKAVAALDEVRLTPCPFEAFGAAIVNHTSTNGLGDLVCIGANDIISGNPTIHGEIAAINNCTDVLRDQAGPYKKSDAEMRTVYHDLTLYTTAEPCAMCAAAIRWAGFKECVFGTSAPTLSNKGFRIIDMRTKELFSRTASFETPTRLLGPVLNNETDELFSWQFHSGHACPAGCERKQSDGTCSPPANPRDEL